MSYKRNLTRYKNKTSRYVHRDDYVESSRKTIMPKEGDDVVRLLNAGFKVFIPRGYCINGVTGLLDKWPINN